ncbi:MAG: metal-dependent hydrolase [Sarcina sp.]
MLAVTHRIGGITFGAVLSLIIQEKLNITYDNPLIFMAITMSGGAVGSLIPDIDSTSSTIGRKFKFISKFVSKKFGHRGGTHTILACIIFTATLFFFTTKLEFYLASEISKEKILFFASINALIVVTSSAFILNSIPNKFRGILAKKNDIYIITFLTLATVFFTFRNTSDVISYIYIYALGITLGYISHIILDLFTKEGVPLLQPISKHRFNIFPFKTGSFIEKISQFINIGILIYCMIKILN